VAIGLDTSVVRACCSVSHVSMEIARRRIERALIAALPSGPHACQITRSVDEGQNMNSGGRHLVEQSVPLNEELSNIRLVELRGDSSSLAESVERGGCVQRLNQQPLGRRPRVSGAVGDGIIEHPLGLIGPDYSSPLRSHFWRRARSTSSCAIVLPAATSA